jgi:lysophospholipase L1-like esterase
MINGGCFFTLPEPDGPGLTLHTSYSGSQLDAAVSFLRSHRHQVSPVTVSVGGIDAADVIAETCNFDATCVRKSGLRDHLGRNLDRILAAVRDAAPEAEIVLIVFYNPFTISNPGSDGLWRRNYTSVQKEAARENHVRIVDVAEVVHGRNVCELTFLCASGDSHPTDAGYRRIGNEIFDVAGYERLVGDDD